MDLSFDGDAVLNVDVLFIRTTWIESDMSLLVYLEYIPFRMRAGHFHLWDKTNQTSTQIKTGSWQSYNILCQQGTPTSSLSVVRFSTLPRYIHDPSLKIPVCVS